jgi:hypothetical protein
MNVVRQINVKYYQYVGGSPPHEYIYIYIYTYVCVCVGGGGASMGMLYLLGHRCACVYVHFSL